MGMTIFKNNVPVICILKHIGNDSMLGDGVMGEDFVRELTMIENNGYGLCEVWINSVGGSVVEGMAIYDAIKNSKITVNTKCIGVAASMAGVIFQAGATRTMNDYSRLMVHGVSGGSQEATDSLSESIVTMLSAKCPDMENKIRKMMDGESFISADKCKSMGLCDEVITTNEVVNLDEKGLFSAFNSLKEVVNKLVLDEPKTKKKMLKITNSLNLTEDASEDSILKEIENFKAQIVSLTNTIAEKEAAMAKIEEDKKTAELEKEAVELVVNSIKEGRIEEASKDSFIALAKSNLEGTKNAILAMPVRSIANKLDLGKGLVGGESRAGWDYDKWQKEDGAGLTNMYKNSKAEYDALYETFKNKNK